MGAEPVPTALDAGARLAAGELSAVELLDATLDRIDDLDPGLRAFITVCDEQAREAAVAADRARAAGGAVGPLHGVPVAVKDLEETAGVRTTFGAAQFADHVPDRDSVVVERLRDAGMVLVGKTNTPEFGLLGETRSQVVGETLNPWDRTRTAGGSSGGSAVAVAAGMLPIATGSDTAGSLPCPAAMCGVFGLKPTRGLVPTWPDPGDSRLLLDSGPLARTVADARALLAVLAGPDPRDPTSYVGADGEVPSRPLRIAWTPGWSRLAVDPEVRDAVGTAASAFAELGHEVEEAHPRVGDPFEILEPIVAADGWALVENARVDLEALSPEARQEIELLGRPTLSEYVAALNELTRFRREIDRFFERFDLVLTPATAVPAFPVGQPPTMIGEMAVEPRWTTFMPFPAPWNLVGSPTASIPCGLTAGGLPIGLLISGPRGCEATLLAAAEGFERVRPWSLSNMI